MSGTIATRFSEPFLSFNADIIIACLVKIKPLCYAIKQLIPSIF